MLELALIFAYYKYLNRNMGVVKQIDIKNRTYYFYNNIDLKNFDAGLFKIIGYIKIKKKNDDYESIYSLNPLYLRIDHASRYIEEKNGNKYLNFDPGDENKELLKKYNDVWNGMKNKIKEVSSGECDYEKVYMKIKFNSDDDLLLNRPLKFHLMTITIGRVFSEDGKFYPQLFLDDTLYELV